MIIRIKINQIINKSADNNSVINNNNNNNTNNTPQYVPEHQNYNNGNINTGTQEEITGLIIIEIITISITGTIIGIDPDQLVSLQSNNSQLRPELLNEIIILYNKALNAGKKVTITWCPAHNRDCRQ